MTSSLIELLLFLCTMQSAQLASGWDYKAYPNFCQAKPFRMLVGAEGCESIKIQNNFCYGQCLSQFFPAGWRRDVPNGLMACSVCNPVATAIRRVVLKCSKRKEKYLVQKVNIVKKCKCRVAFCKVMSYFYR